LTHDKLTDYQVAEAFGQTLSRIYKDKISELNEELSTVYEHIVSLQIPKYTGFHRQFFEDSMPTWAKSHIKSIEHINKIRRIWLKMKDMPENERLERQRLDYMKAKEVPIETLYPFKHKGKNVSCPFHGSDKNPSMSLKFNRFNCFTCGENGSTIDFMMKINNWTLKQSVEYLNKL